MKSIPLTDNVHQQENNRKPIDPLLMQLKSQLVIMSDEDVSQSTYEEL